MAVKCPVKGGWAWRCCHTGLCASRVHYSLTTEGVRVCWQLLTVPRASRSGCKLSVPQIAFQMTHCITMMALNQCGISIFTPTEGIFTRHNSIQSWHLVIAIKHEGHPFYYFFLYKLSEHNFIHIKKIICHLIWPTHTPLISPTSQASQHITHTFSTRVYQLLDLTPTQNAESPLPRVSSLPWKFLKKEKKQNKTSSLNPSTSLSRSPSSARQTPLSPSRVRRKLSLGRQPSWCYTQESGDPGYCSAL